MRFTALVFGLWLPVVIPSLGQERDTLNNTFIRSYSDYFLVWPVLKQRSLNFTIRDLDNNRVLGYKPNNSYTLGLGAHVFDLSFEFTFAVPIQEKNPTIYGHSQVRDFQINALGRSWGADLFIQRYTGFYSDNGKTPAFRSYTIRPDITARNVGITGIYVFQPERYSLRSAFTFSERQLVSGGSVMLSGTLNGFKVVGDSALLAVDDGATGSTFRKLQYTTLSLAPGYAYTFVRGHFFASGALTAGPAHNWIYHLDEDGRALHDIRFDVFTTVKVGAGYSTDTFFAGFNFSQQSRTVRVDELRFTNNSSTFRLLFGFRFREFGVLKKSAADLPRELSQL
jgi:hypothetical protein